MNEKLNKLFNESTKMPIMVGVVSFAAGVGVTLGVNYIRNRKNSTEKLPPHKVPKLGSVTLLEPAKPKDAVSKRYVDNGSEWVEKPEEEVSQPDPAEVGKDFVEQKMEENVSLITVEGSDEAVEVTSRNVFAGSDDEWDYDTEVKSRSSSAPYILHKDEFYADELNYAQITLTYYSGDDILVDEEEAPIYNHNQIVGPMKFGHGSGDPNVFYIRNDKRRAEYEILKDPGMYSVEVLGLSLERTEASKDLRHSHHTPRFHMD